VKRISFYFRCTAFGVSYYDCVIRSDSGPGTQFEVETQESPETIPPMTARYGRPVPDDVTAAWVEFCKERREKYRQWLDLHPDCKEFDTIFKTATA